MALKFAKRQFAKFNICVKDEKVRPNVEGARPNGECWRKGVF